MNAKRWSIGIPVAIGLALVLLLLIAAGAMAGSPPSRPALAGGPEPVIAARTATTPTFWTSGWVLPSQGETLVFTHSLGGNPDDYAVDLQFRDFNEDGCGINTRAYGGLETGGKYYGAYWQNLTSNTIQVRRNANDTFAGGVRVLVWVPEEPDYCSPWTPISPASTEVFTHNLGGNVDDYVVGLWFKDLNDGYGINQRAYGGLADGSLYRGAYWQNLTASTVAVYRFSNDIFADQVRICLTRANPPDWDSGWRAINAGDSVILTHNLRWSPTLYLVRMEFNDTTSLQALAPRGGPPLGINHYAAGGMAEGSGATETRVGANWENLTSASIRVFRHNDDVHAEQVRVRIWLLTQKLYLPLALRNYP